MTITQPIRMELLRAFSRLEEKGYLLEADPVRVDSSRDDTRTALVYQDMVPLRSDVDLSRVPTRRALIRVFSEQ